MVDTSSITNAGNYPQPPNLLTTLSGYQSLMNAQQANNLSRAQQANTEQNTINLGTQNNTEQMNQEIKRHIQVGQQFMALSMSPDQNPDDYYKLVDQGVANPNPSLRITPQEAQQYKADIAKAAASPNPAAALRAAAMQHAQSVQTVNDQIKANTGPLTFVDGQPIRGPSDAALLANPNAPATSGGPRVLGTQGPTIQTGGIDREPFLPDGTTPNPNYMKSPVLAIPAQPPPVYPGGATAPAPTGGDRYTPPAAGQSTMGTGTASGRPVSVPQQGATGAATAPGGQPVVLTQTGGAPGAEAQQRIDQDMYNGEQAQASTHLTNVQSLTKAHDALEMVGTGVGTPQALATLRSYVQGIMTTVGYTPGWLKTTSAKDMAAAELDKYLTDYARQTATGAGTNLDQQLAASSNASGHINPQAARDVIITNIGRERMAAAAAQNLAMNGYPTAKSNFYSKTDPHAFALDMMTQDEIRAMQAKMTETQKQKFAASVHFANGNNPSKTSYLEVHRQNQFKGGITADPSASATNPPAAGQ